MTRSLVQTSPTEADARVDLSLSPPKWVQRHLHSNGSTWLSATHTGIIRLLHMSAGGLSLFSAHVVDAARLSAADFQSATIDAYHAIFKKLSHHPAHHPVRFWNFLPSIHQPVGDGRDRYMVFNAGRFQAFEQRFGGREAFDNNIATASAVGHDSADLIIHCLAAEHPGRHIGNPRQISPHRYSAKFGPLPPCFARATIVESVKGSRRLLVGGTASIRGEETVHVGDLRKQLDETLHNLAALIDSAGEAGSPTSESQLACFRELRVYHPRPTDAPMLAKALPGRFPNVRQIELLRADLCRSELLVEIEGVADL